MWDSLNCPFLIDMSLDPDLIDHARGLPEGPYRDKEAKVLFGVLSCRL